MKTLICDDPVQNLVQKTALEDLISRGVMDERDIDYLNHLKLSQEDIDDVALEGFIKAQVHDAASMYTDSYREMKGWFLGMESKRKYIVEICQDVVDWLKDKQTDYRDLDLDMGSFKTWMKTSESFFWRYYFLLDDNTWSQIESNLKSGNITKLETIYDIDFTARKNLTDKLDSVRDIAGLIKIVNLYRTRSDKFFELILKRQIKIKMAPFQVILLGANDLRRTVKKIVNLAT